MDLKQIEKLMASMKQSGIKRIVIKRQDVEIELERESAPSISSEYVPAPIYVSQQSTANEPRHKAAAEPAAAASSAANYVTSPMVGTYYASPSPEEPPFVKQGDTVNEDSVVCIVEAMKVMNEVKAGINGTISEILLKNGEPVEFGTRIFRVS